jgi:prophage regulatory protein
MERFLTLVEVERVTSLKKSKLYEMVKEGQFPLQRAVTSRRRAWLASEVQSWILLRASGVDANVSQASSSGGVQ